MSSEMSARVQAYIKRVKELADHVRGNEQATKQSLIGPFFSMLGWDLTDPRECIPEHKADFGKERSTKPIDWAFLNNGVMAFFVEAKEVGRKLSGFDEQLADYFAKDSNVKLGILTNGAQWRFFTDLNKTNIMDHEPFATWDVLSGEPPYDVLTLLSKAKFNSELIRTYAERQRQHNLLVGEISRLLDPDHDFTKLAIANVETRKLTQGVVEHWKPIVASAIDEWARQRVLKAALAAPATKNDDTGRDPRVETTAEELQAIEMVQELLGADCKIQYEDSVSYLKLHLPEKRTWAFARLLLDKRQPVVHVPLTAEETQALVAERAVSSLQGWSVVTLSDAADIANLGPLFKAAYASVKADKSQAA